MTKKHKIFWSCAATGGDYDYFIGNLADARKSAKDMIGKPVYFDGEEVGKIEAAYVVDDNGNEI